MTFQQAIQSGFQNFTNFKDRSCRSEYWYWVLFAVIAGVVGGILDRIIGTNFLQFLVAIALFVPGLAVAARRMHDIGKSARILLLGLIPFVGLYLIYLAVQPSEPGPNAYGAGPLPPPA
ncbi:MAG TPA: DUF805 domain-containing protein [Tepidiformaceae bacterium]|nr:DUF805 domain-containing protein [Tepidiformaceae bacterium]